MNKLFTLSYAALLCAVPAFAAAPAAPVAPPLEIEQQVHCSLIFAIVAVQQSNRAPAADRFAPMAGSGKAFFVATGLRIFNEKIVTEATIEGYYAARVSKIQADLAAAPSPAAALDREMAQCVPLLAQGAPEVSPAKH